MSEQVFISIAGGAAGLVNGLLGAGGGMVLVPLLTKRTGLAEEERFPSSIAIIAPICIISLICSANWQIELRQVLPYLLGSTVGGIGAGLWGRHIPTVWLHRILGAIILIGGIRYLC